jgi:acylphosphatase
MTQQCRRFLVSGRVQGVWFRASTQRAAKQMGLVGWVRNLSDGRVEAVACGEAQTLADFEAWLGQGPEHAHVEAVESEEHPSQDFDSFAVV